MPAGDGDEGDSLGVVADLLDEGGGLLHDLVETVLAPLQIMISCRIWKSRKKTCLSSVHLVDGDDELLDTESEGEESVLASLAVLGDTGLELTSAGGDDEDGAVSLGSTGDHVLDEVTVAGGVDDLESTYEHNK